MDDLDSLVLPGILITDLRASVRCPIVHQYDLYLPHGLCQQAVYAFSEIALDFKDRNNS